MNSRAKGILLGLIAMQGMMGKGNNSRCRTFDLDDDPTPPRKIPNGCAEYIFNGITVVAISEKSARKKCERLSRKLL